MLLTACSPSIQPDWWGPGGRGLLYPSRCFSPAQCDHSPPLQMRCPSPHLRVSPSGRPSLWPAGEYRQWNSQSLPQPQPSRFQPHPCPIPCPDPTGRALLPPLVMLLTFVPGVESRTENKHNLKSGQGMGLGGMEKANCRPSIFPAYCMAPLMGHKAQPYRIPGPCVPAPSCLSWSSELGAFPHGSHTLGPQWSVPVGLQRSHGPETTSTPFSNIPGF